MLNKTMYRTITQLLVAVFLSSVTAVSYSADESKSTSSVKHNSPTRTTYTIRYMPPLPGDTIPAPDATNSVLEGETSLLQVMAPDHTGLTTQGQPTLYWYTSSPAALHFSIKEAGNDSKKPLLELSLKKASGIQKLDLAKHNITLKPDILYQWSVTQAPENNSKKNGKTVYGFIEKIKPGEGLSKRIKRVTGIARVDVYAIEGIWYDAWQTISSMLEKSPDNPGLLAARNSLLSQAGLHAVVEK